MTALALALQAESWLQEELDAQRSLCAALERTEAAARAAASADLERCGRELEALAALGPAREARRRALLGRLAAELDLSVKGLTLARICAALAERGHEVERLGRGRAELRAAAAAVVKASRRLCALASYHRGLLEELCQTFLAQAPAAAGGHLVDARA